MRWIVVFLLFTLSLSGGAWTAEGAPQLIEAGIYPSTIGPGEDFTVYAQVAVADGAADITTVGLVYEDALVLELPESTEAGVYYQTFTAPMECGSGVFPMYIGAVDTSVNVSNLLYFVFSIQPAGGDSVQLIEPENGSMFDCVEPPQFVWEPFAGALGYTFQLFLPFGVDASINVPASVTSIPVPLPIWYLVPEGEYTWRVGAIMEEGVAASHWSDLRTFTKDCQGGPPAEFSGIIADIDPVERLVFVNARGEDVIIPVLVSEDTVITDETGTALTFEDLAAGMQVWVRGQPGAESGVPFVAEEIVVHRYQPPACVVGEIRTIDPAAMTFAVGPCEDGTVVMVQVTATTEILDMAGQVLAFEDLTVGMVVRVRGEWQGAMLLAHVIRIHDHQPPPPPPVVIGEIVAVDPDAMMIHVDPREWSGDVVPVQVTDGTLIHTIFGGELTFGDLQVGMMVHVIGEIQGGILLAIEIMVHDFQPPPPTGIEGIIMEVDPQAMRLVVVCINDPVLVVQVLDDTVITDGMGNELTFADLEPQQLIHATGELLGDLFAAAEIVVFDFQPPPVPEVRGEIVEILPDARQIMVAPVNEPPVVVQVNIVTLIISDTGMMLDFEDLAVGQHVNVAGEWAGDILHAMVITVMDGPPPSPDVIEGVITAIDPQQMMLHVDTHGGNVIPVHVTAATVITDLAGNELSFSDLVLLQRIMAEGEWLNDLFQAAHIMVFDFQPPPAPGEVHGIIIELNPAQQRFVVMANGRPVPVAVQVTPDTLIIDAASGGIILFEDLETGQQVHAHGEWEGDVLLAFEVMVFDFQPPPGDELHGMIAAIDPASMMVHVICPGMNEIAVQVTGETVITAPDGTPLNFADLQPQMVVHIIGAWQGDLFVAVEIQVFDFQPPPPTGELHGVITEINLADMTLLVDADTPPGPVVVQVHEGTDLFGMTGELLTFTDLEVWQRIFVTGTWEGDVLVADMIMVFNWSMSM
ncbi:hypothetical protein JW905_18045 [bacterium]|nr:hypothetical protein [candidate division CSSED10-310 bacterium]